MVRRACGLTNGRWLSALATFDHVAGAPGYKVDEGLNAYERFKAYYRLDASSAEVPPLMVVDMAKPRPFALYSSLEQWADVVPAGRRT